MITLNPMKDQMGVVSLVNGHGVTSVIRLTYRMRQVFVTFSADLLCRSGWADKCRNTVVATVFNEQNKLQGLYTCARRVICSWRSGLCDTQILCIA